MSFWFYICLLLLKDTKLALLFFKTKKDLLEAISVADSIFVFPYYHTGGAEKVHYRISKIAKESGLKPCFIFTEQSKTNTYLEQFEHLGFVVDLGFRYSNTRINNALKKHLLNKLNSANPKFVFGSNNRFFYDLISCGLKVKTIDLIHAYNPPFETSNVYFKDIFYKIDKRIFINEPSLKKMQDFYKSELAGLDSSNFQLIYNSVYEENIEPNISINKDLNQVFKIVFVARNSPEKRPQIAFNIAKSLTYKFPNRFNFLMIGDFDDYRPDFESNNIKIISNLKDAEEIVDYYKVAHSIILTSETEGFPLAISEAMFFNTVPICTDVGGISFVLQDKVNSILINSQLDEIEIVSIFCKKIIELSEDEILYRQLSSSVFATAKKYFSNVEFSKKYKSFFSAQ